MKLRGILNLALGNFLCLRGYARMGDLYRISEADDSYQRDLIQKHRKEMVSFLESKRFLFFPEVILGGSLVDDDINEDKAYTLIQKVQNGEKISESLDSFRINTYVKKSTSRKTGRTTFIFNRAVIFIAEKKLKLISLNFNV